MVELRYALAPDEFFDRLPDFLVPRQFTMPFAYEPSVNVGEQREIDRHCAVPVIGLLEDKFVAVHAQSGGGFLIHAGNHRRSMRGRFGESSLRFRRTLEQGLERARPFLWPGAEVVEIDVAEFVALRHHLGQARKSVEGLAGKFLRVMREIEERDDFQEAVNAAENHHGREGTIVRRPEHDQAL